MPVDVTEGVTGDETDELISWYSNNNRYERFDAFDRVSGNGSIEELANGFQVRYFRHITTILTSIVCRKSFVAHA